MKYLRQVSTVDTHVPIAIVKTENVLVLSLHLSPHMKNTQQIQKQLEINPLGLSLLHLLLKQLTNPRKQRMPTQINNLLKILYLNRLHILLIQRPEQLL